jgi:predicted nuclease with TOPRIM domain
MRFFTILIKKTTQVNELHDKLKEAEVKLEEKAEDLKSAHNNVVELQGKLEEAKPKREKSKENEATTICPKLRKNNCNVAERQTLEDLKSMILNHDLIEFCMILILDHYFLNDLILI